MQRKSEFKLRCDVTLKPLWHSASPPKSMPLPQVRTAPQKVHMWSEDQLMRSSQQAGWGPRPLLCLQRSLAEIMTRYGSLLCEFSSHCGNCFREYWGSYCPADIMPLSEERSLPDLCFAGSMYSYACHQVVTLTPQSYIMLQRSTPDMLIKTNTKFA